MGALLEIENAAFRLPLDDQQKLALFFAARRRSEDDALRASRDFLPEEVSAWIAENELDGKAVQSKQ